MSSLDEYEPLLSSCSETGDIDYTIWPTLLPHLISRITHIANNDFTIPRPYPILNPVLPSQTFIDNPPILASNAPRVLPPVPAFTEPACKLPLEVLQLLNQSLNTLQTTFPTKPPHTVQRLAELILDPTKHYRTLPSWLRALDRIVSVTSGADIFPLSDQPPNIGLNSNGVLNTNTSGILFGGSSNDTRNGYDRESLGSDESLGGALLSPISWLRDSDFRELGGEFADRVQAWRETDEEMLEEARVAQSEVRDHDVDEVRDQAQREALEEELRIKDSHGQREADAAATVMNVAHAEALAAVAQEHSDSKISSGSGVTQGELIRMEQEAGIVPVPHDDPPRLGDQGIELDDEDLPHARGPDVVGTVDMGKVEGMERQVRISSPPVEAIDINDAQQALSGGRSEEKSPGDEFVKVDKDEVEGKDVDEDIVLVDADESVGKDEVTKA